MYVAYHHRFYLFKFLTKVYVCIVIPCPGECLFHEEVSVQQHAGNQRGQDEHRSSQPKINVIKSNTNMVN